ncbi:hypothetical protein GCM10010343_16950 [Streptomyces avidinii]|nr:hypothetical protein GCM10010343_16950 [Streptomyces avidinii]
MRTFSLTGEVLQEFSVAQLIRSRGPAGLVAADIDFRQPQAAARRRVRVDIRSGEPAIRTAAGAEQTACFTKG